LVDAQFETFRQLNDAVEVQIVTGQVGSVRGEIVIEILSAPPRILILESVRNLELEVVRSTHCLPTRR
jgi:hypothetical protein